ncbi:Hsp20/alpha crystallin family protein [Halosimplex litoreum]|uniref:Hsp20/alpha crystallin family protein n=2 Tax=Halosimplex litoreum TaxID=1198301 RepID=A0A7U3WT83_9EURY|nr:Hsp20/alpha crystallin family protein [Halosimplex litoreum]
MDRLFEQMRRNMHAAWNAPIGSWDERGPRPAFEAERRGADDGEMVRPTGDYGDVNLQFERIDDEFVVIGDLPGFEREEIDVQFDDGYLSIEAVHEVEDDEHYRTRHVSERARIADDVVADEATATYSNGVLELRFPLADSGDGATAIDVE